MNETITNVETAVAEYIETQATSTAEKARDCFAEALDRMYEQLGFSYRRWKVGHARDTIRSPKVIARLEKDLEEFTLTGEAGQTALLCARVHMTMTQLPGESYMFAESYRGNNEFKRNLSRLKESGKNFVRTAFNTARQMRHETFFAALDYAIAYNIRMGDKRAKESTAYQESKKSD